MVLERSNSVVGLAIRGVLDLMLVTSSVSRWYILIPWSLSRFLF